MNDHLPPTSQRFRRERIWLLLALAGPIVLYLVFGWLPVSHICEVRVFFEDYDLRVFFHATRWMTEGGTLYYDVLSEYPPAANFLFATVRVVSDLLKPFPSALDSFIWVWMSAVWMTYIAVVRLAFNHLPRHAVWLWLNPVILYFSLYRYDLYPAAMTLLAMLATSRERYLTAAVCLGVAATLKGYPLFLVPAFSLYVWKRTDFVRGVNAGLICLALFVMPIMIVASYAGWDAAMLPFEFQAGRKLDPNVRSSTYDACIDALGMESVQKIAATQTVPRTLQLATVLLAACVFPRRLDQLAVAFLIAVSGFLLFARFFSPQFVIWLVPFAVYADSRLIRATVHIALIAAWIFYPVGFDLKAADPGSIAKQEFYTVMVLVMALTRFGVIAAALAAAWSRRNDKPD